VSGKRKHLDRQRNRTGESGAGAQLKQLRAMVKKLRVTLEHEVRKRHLDSKALAEAGKAGTQVSQKMEAVRRQGRKLTARMRGGLNDTSRRGQVRRRVLAKVAELKTGALPASAELERSGQAEATSTEAGKHSQPDFTPQKSKHGSSRGR